MSGSSSKPIAALSIDGRGVRGIIPGIMLEFLESELQPSGILLYIYTFLFCDLMDGNSNSASISNKFSYLMTQMSPKISLILHVDSFLEESGGIKKLYYDGKYLHKLAKDTLGDKRLHDITLTKIVIPAYDIKKLSPTSALKLWLFQVDDGNKKLDAFLSDICISTSAAPVYLPAYKFSNEGVEFNCIDGGVAANSPTVAAITEAVKKRSEETDGNKEIDLNDFRLLVLSLGTGEYKEEKYNAALANSWWAINWLIYPLRTFWKADHPLPEILFDANSDMNDYYCTMFFESFSNPENFLRVQDDKLPKELSRLDNGTPANLDKLEHLDKLEQYAKNLLNKPVTTLNSATFDRYEIEAAVTYGEALKEFARKLYDIKHSQKANTKVKVKTIISFVH
ncbi:hypothetical protein UlMin_044428 [Ulmus minor]